MMVHLNLLDPPTPEISMPAYDGLPAEVRTAIAGADFAYDPRIVARRIGRGVRAERIIAEIQTFQRRPQPWW